MKNLNKMKLFKYIILFIIILSVFSFSKVDAKSDIKDMNVGVYVRKDGKINVKEKMTIDFSELSTLFRKFGPSVTENQVSNIGATLTLDGKVYNLERSQVKKEQDLGKYHFGKYEGNLEIGVGVPRNSKYQTATIVYSYTLDGFVRVHNDVSELYYKILDSSNEISMDKYHMVIAFEGGPVNKENSKIWAHTDVRKNKGVIKFEKGMVILDVIGKLRSGVMLEPRILYPKEYSSLVPKQYMTGAMMKEKIIAEENNQEVRTKEKIEKSKKAEKSFLNIFNFVGIPIFAILTSISGFLTFKFRKEKKAYTEDLKNGVKEFEYFTEIPEKAGLDIMKISLFENGKIPIARALDFYKAGILKLQYLKVITVNKENVTHKTLLGEKTEEKLVFKLNDDEFNSKKQAGEIQEIDEIVYNELKEAGTDNKTTELDIKDRYKNSNKFYYNVSSKLTKISEEKEKELENEGILLTNEALNEKLTTKKKALKFILGSLILAILTIGLIFVVTKMFNFETFGGGSVPIMATVAVFVISIISLFLVNYSNHDKFNVDGLQTENEVKALKRHLNDFSLINELGEEALVKWEKYLIYATVFGISEKVYKKIKDINPEFSDQLGTFMTLGALNSNSVLPASTGAGGGFSSGGGAGFGGGGFGGR